MRIRYNRDVVAFGGPHWTGNVQDVPPEHPDTRLLLGCGWASEVKEDPAVVEAQTPATEVQTVKKQTRVVKRKKASK